MLQSCVWIDFHRRHHAKAEQHGRTFDNSGATPPLPPPPPPHGRMPVDANLGERTSSNPNLYDTISQAGYIDMRQMTIHNTFKDPSEPHYMSAVRTGQQHGEYTPLNVIANQRTNSDPPPYTLY